MEKKRFFWLYVLECENGNYYTGYTNNLLNRYSRHIDGSAGAKYTRSFRPVRLAQCWKLYDTKGMALKIESFIKRKPRIIKQELIKNPRRLKILIYEKLNLELKILPFDPGKVEKEILNKRQIPI